MKRTITYIALLIASLITNDLLACTVFYVRNGTMVLAGVNEDWISAESYMWFRPPERGKHGRVFFGFDLFLDHKEPFGGVNDHGLFFQSVLVPKIKAMSEITGETYNGNLLEKILEECSSVEEVVKLTERYNNLQYYSNTHIMFGDKNGNSMIMELGKVIQRDGRFLILPIADENPCDQYTIAHEALSSNTMLSVDLCKRILANVHVEGTLGSGTTVYSAIYDLNDGKIHLYYFHNFAEELVLDLGQELKKGSRTLDIASLFPKNVAAEDYRGKGIKDLNQRVETRKSKNAAAEEREIPSGRFVSADPASKDGFEIVREDEKLYIVTNHGRRFRLLPEAPTKFFIPLVSGEFTVTFLKDDDGIASRVLAEYEFLGIQQMFRKVQ